jgi:hypothetical protein
MNRSEPNQGTMPEFSWTHSVKPQQLQRGQPVSGLNFEPGTSRIQSMAVEGLSLEIQFRERYQ